MLIGLPTRLRGAGLLCVLLGGGAGWASCAPPRNRHQSATPAGSAPGPAAVPVQHKALPKPSAAAAGAVPADASNSGAGLTGDAETPDEPTLAPLRAAAGVVDLDVEGFGPAVVSLPLGATEPRPVLVATHGNYDRPEWTCGVWRDILGDRGFVLCPRGVQWANTTRDPRYHHASNRYLEREIEASLASLNQAYAQYVGPPPHAYAGFSQGAIMGVAILVRRPEWFDRAVLIEGGFDRWSQTSVRDYAAGGGRRVLFVCGQWTCDHGAQAARRWFEAAQVEQQVRTALGAGHTYGGAIADLTQEGWEWLVAGDERWALQHATDQRGGDPSEPTSPLP